MNEVKTTLKRLSVYYLLVFAGTLSCDYFISDTFPTRNFTTVYILVLSAGLILYYSYRVLRSGYLSFMMKSISWMAFLMIFLRGMKYSAFAGVDMLARHIWYAYYVPMLLIPMFFFYTSLMISPEGGTRIPKKWLWVAGVTAAFVMLVLTNDLHQLVFRFQPDFADWDSDYDRGVLFYIINGWQYVLYIVTVLILVFKNRAGSTKKGAWLTVIPFSLGIIMSVLLITGKMPKVNGANIIEFPEAHILMVTGMLECCIQSGLIHTNNGYEKLFANLSISAQITDRSAAPVYSSRTAAPLTPEQFSAPDGARIGGHTVLHKMELPGGFGFWQEDMTELDRLNQELSEAREGLAQETELIRLKNELREKQIKIEQRTAMYDMIAKHNRRQSEAISELAEKGRLSSDPAVKESCARRITLLASYMKRYANLMLLSYESRTVETGELGLSFSEVLRYLNFSGIPGEFFNRAEGAVPAGAALEVFKTFGMLLQDNLSVLCGVFINLSRKNGILCKLTLENLRTSVPEEQRKALSDAGVSTEIIEEDDITYISFLLPEGGDACE